MLKSKLWFLSLVLGAATALQAQKLPTASRTFDIQAGGSFVYGESDYGRTMKGYGGYGTIDFKPHFGLMLDFHQANATDKIYERTYEVGGRYVRRHSRFDLYAKGMYGRGVFNFPPYFPGGESRANLAYNLVGFGGGVDYHAKRFLNVRGDFEYQEWLGDGSFLPHGLSPYIVSLGAAYHF